MARSSLNPDRATEAGPRAREMESGGERQPAREAAERLDPDGRERELEAVPLTRRGEAKPDEEVAKPKAAEKTRERSSPGRRVLTIAVVVIVLAIAAGAGVIWWLSGRDYETTDDAFIDARVVNISSQVSGAIVAVPVTDNQLVNTGALLIEIDPRDYQAALVQAQAQVAQAQSNIASLQAQIDAQKARIDQAQKQAAQTQAALTYAQQESERYQDLLRRNAGTRQQEQQAHSNLIQAQANLASAEANAVATEKQIPVIETQRQTAVGALNQAEANVEPAQTNLDRTRITAPEPGRATRITGAVGQYAQPGQVLMLFVPENKWVTANFKETELTDMRPGQPVDIKIDAYPGRIFHGHIASIQAGSGAAFSLLPPQNATGNFVKVVQRVPVKITFDTPPDVYIGPGMSVVPSVKVR
jgi:membrane fusion protein, multidrug efflux system